MFEKTAYEISDNLFIGLVAGAVVVGVVTICGGYYYLTGSSKKEPETKTAVSIQEQTLLQTPTGKPSSIGLLGSQIAAQTERALEREKLLKELRYGALEDGKNNTEHSTLEEALRDLESRKKIKTDGALTLKIKIPIKLIGDDKKEDFLSWLSRVGDFIFVKRILLLEPDEVLLNTDFPRVGPTQIRERGNIIFSEEQDFWLVEIRGLRNFVREIQTVAEFIERAIQSPQFIIAFNGFVPTQLSVLMNTYLKSSQKDMLEKKEALLCDRVVEVFTLNKQLAELNIKSNIQAFLPLVDFSTAPNIRASQRATLEEKTLEFLTAFDREVMPEIKKQPDAKTNSIRNIRDFGPGWLMKHLRTWVIESNLIFILDQSLFNLHQNHHTY